MLLGDWFCASRKREVGRFARRMMAVSGLAVERLWLAQFKAHMK